jgi:hypothetical protein
VKTKVEKKVTITLKLDVNEFKELRRIVETGLETLDRANLELEWETLFDNLNRETYK